MATTLRIGGVSICGVIGEDETFGVAVDDCWSAYRKWLDKHVDGPYNLMVNVPWTINDRVIKRPTAWFMIILDSRHHDINDVAYCKRLNVHTIKFSTNLGA